MADGRPQRGITLKFEEQLKEGILSPLLELVQNDDTLSLEIRSNFVDIYYRGGRLLGIHEQAKGARFWTDFDEDYFGKGDEYRLKRPTPTPSKIIKSKPDAQTWVDVFGAYKQAMDIRLSLHAKLEREYQQAVVRDNNRHAIGEQTDYVIIDVEYTQSKLAIPGQKADYRFDMVGFRRPLPGRAWGRSVMPVIIEMKAGDGAIASRCKGGDSGDLTPGLVKHVQDFERFLGPVSGEQTSGPFELLRKELVETFGTKQRLRLRSLPKPMLDLKITDVGLRPEVLFVLANHNPRSKILARELAKLARLAHDRADYRIATVSHAGYALFAKNVKPLDEFVAQATAEGVPEGTE